MSSMTRGAIVRPIYYLFDQGTLVGSSDAQLLERFVANRDETAFEALIARHGRSVQAVCRDVLRDPHDADDAFQATFLILVRKAGSLWVNGSLAAWLHRVARRVAIEANRQKTRRRAFEKSDAGIERAQASTRAWTVALGEAIHEEIDRLPEKYRVLIILCDLEELTRDEAARRLGWPPGTVAGRLARARMLLRDRIARRGQFDVGADLNMADAKRGEVPVVWITKAAQLATLSPAGNMKIPGGALVGGAALARSVTRAMTVANVKNIAAIFIAAALVPAVIALAVSKAPSATRPTAVFALQEDTASKPVSGPRMSPHAKVPVAGVVVLQDGLPAKGTRVFYSTLDHGLSYGEVRATTDVDARGRFSLDIPPVEAPMPGWVGTGVLWAFRPGSLVASMPVYRGALPEGLPQRLVVGPPARARFEVRCPDGTPAVGARIEPRVLNRNNSSVPDGLAALIGADTLTSARGRAVMNAFFLEEIETIRVTFEKFGQQDFSFGSEELTSDTRVVTLQPVGRLKGRLVGEPDAIRRRSLNVSGFSRPGDPVQRSFIQEITTDDDGRFDIPAIAVGRHGIQTVPRFDLPWYADTEGLLDVESGQTTEVVLSLQRAVPVHGVVREKDTKKGIGGVRVAAALAETAAMTSGEDGTYEGFVPPGATWVTPRALPPGYVMPIFEFGQVVVPKGAGDFTLPPLELTRAGEVHGLVVGEHARPVAGAEVEASWNLVVARRGPARHRLSVRTGPDGRFVFDRVPDGVEVALSARHHAFRTAEPRLSRTGETSILRLEPASCVALFGRVVDLAGRPIAGANVHLRSRPSIVPNGWAKDGDPVEFESGYVLVTDALGRFRSPEELDPNAHYVAYASAADRRYTRTHWMQGDRRSFGDLVLQPETETAAAPKSPR